jgi:hypothetical protein
MVALPKFLLSWDLLPHGVLMCRGEQELPGLTDEEKPRMRGPKRANKIRKLFNLSKVSCQQMQGAAMQRGSSLHVVAVCAASMGKQAIQQLSGREPAPGL